MEKEYRYYAFISYKREDEKWAKWIQRKLESYSLPVSLRKENPSLPEKIRPVFRDQSELASGNLKEEIEKALEESKYIIVLCSPRAAQSPWVSKEVQYYIEKGREDYIIPFIIGGIPNASVPEDECYPTSLRNLKGEREILGININEMGRDAAVIKTIARMFGLRFDTLWQRHKRLRQRRNLLLAAVVGLIVLSVLIFAGVLLNKNNLIESQNEQLRTLVNELQEESITYSQLPSNRKRYNHVGTLLGRSDSWVLTGIAFHPTEPIVAFADQFGYWVHYLHSDVEIMLHSFDKNERGENSSLYFSNDGLKLLTSDFDKSYIWDTNSLQLIAKYDRDSMYDFQDFEDTENLKNQYTLQNYIYDGDVLKVLDENSNIICTTKMPAESDSVLLHIRNPNYNEVLYISDARAAIFDEDNEAFVQFFRGYNRYSFSFSENGDYLIVGNDVYERVVPVDTLRYLPYQYYCKQDFPNFTSEKRYDYDRTSNTLLTNDETSIQIKSGNTVKTLDVIKIYTIGNGQEILSRVLFAGPNRIIAIVDQGDIRVFNAKTRTLVGTLENYKWLENGIGNEQNLCHADAFIADSKYINGRLWVLSSGGVLRIYNVEKLQTETVIELPCDTLKFTRMGCLDKYFIEDDGSRIHYSFSNDSLYYSCDLRSLNP